MCFGIPRIIELNGQKPPLTYKRFQAIISRMELPKKPVASVTRHHMESCPAEIQEKHEETYGVPSLEELGACFSLVGQHLLFCKIPVGFFLLCQSNACYYRQFRKYREMKMGISIAISDHSEITTVNFGICPSGLFPVHTHK